MQRENEVQHVFLVGAKSLGAYGGYETFVYKLTEYHQNKKNIKYHVACKANGDGCMDETKVDGVTRINDHEFEFHNIFMISSLTLYVRALTCRDVCEQHFQKWYSSRGLFLYLMHQPMLYIQEKKN